MKYLAYTFLFLGIAISFLHAKNSKLEKQFDEAFKNTWRVAYLEDPDFPSISKEHLMEALEVGLQLSRSKLEIDGIEFMSIETIPIQEFFEANLGKDFESQAFFDPFDLNKDYSSYREEQLKFLQLYTLDSLQEFMPSSSKQISYEEVLDHLMMTWKAKSKNFTSLKIHGKAVFTRMMNRSMLTGPV